MKQLISTLLILLLSGCQIDPYTHAPTWTGTDWYDAGIRDAISGYAVKDNEIGYEIQQEIQDCIYEDIDVFTSKTGVTSVINKITFP